jgi:hypothetical protein
VRPLAGGHGGCAGLGAQPVSSGARSNRRIIDCIFLVGADKRETFDSVFPVSMTYLVGHQISP